MYGISTWNRSEKTRLLEERDRDGQGGRGGRLRDKGNKISNPIIIEIFIHLDNEKNVSNILSFLQNVKIHGIIVIPQTANFRQDIAKKHVDYVVS